MDPIDICEASALQPFVGCLERRGIGADRYLECQGIPPELVAAGRGKIFKRKAWDFLADVSKREGIETLGVLDGDAFSCDELGALGHSLQQAVTLQDAIDTFRRLVTTFAEGNTVWIERGPEISWLCSRTSRLDPAAHVPNDFSLLVLVALVRMVAALDDAAGTAERGGATGAGDEHGRSAHPGARQVRSEPDAGRRADAGTIVSSRAEVRVQTMTQTERRGKPKTRMTMKP